MVVKKYSVIVKKPNVSNFIVTVSGSIKPVMDVTVLVAIIWKSMHKKGITLFWYWWIGIQILSVKKLTMISISKDVIAKNLSVWKSTASATKQVLSAGKTVNVTNAKMVEEEKSEKKTEWKDKLFKLEKWDNQSQVFEIS